MSAGIVLIGWIAGVVAMVLHLALADGSWLGAFGMFLLVGNLSILAAVVWMIAKAKVAKLPHEGRSALHTGPTLQAPLPAGKVAYQPSTGTVARVSDPSGLR